MIQIFVSRLYIAIWIIICFCITVTRICRLKRMEKKKLQKIRQRYNNIKPTSILYFLTILDILS